MHDDSALVAERLERVMRTVQPHVWETLGTFSAAAWAVNGEPVPVARAIQQRFEPLAVGTPWGRAWDTLWLRLDAEVDPAVWDQIDARFGVEACIDLGFTGDWAGNQCEGLVRDEHLRVLKAVNPMNQTVPLAKPSSGRVRLWLEAAANPNLSHQIGHVTSLGDPLTAGPEPLYVYRGATLARRRDEVYGLLMDLEVLHGLMLQLPEKSTRRARILRALEDCADTVDPSDVVGCAAAARAVLAPALAARANASAQVMAAVGHAHIDSAWLWPIRETRRKTVRTFSNVLALAEAEPDFHFACTTAQQYEWVRTDCPELFERIRTAIAAGQWHPMGGMWVESDANLPSGEALVRQFTSGLRWMQEHLGQRPTCLWLPDSFGYTAALPQIARLAGMQWFFTQKMSWNRTNTMPHNTFWWEGLDGTRMFAHFPPVNCYDSVVSPEEVKRAEANFAEKGRASWSLLPFGYGDGGGGPTREMVERIHRLANTEDSPRLVQTSPDDFYQHAHTEYAAQAPTWAGELYLEFHRGCYTSQHAMKEGNRTCEALLVELELLVVLAEAGTDQALAQTIEDLWRRVLLLQFHDILPGSSIAWVHRQAREEYTDIASDIHRLRDELLARIPGVAGPAVLNGTALDRREVIETPTGPTLVSAPAFSITPLATEHIHHPVTLTQAEGTITLDNGLLRVVIDADGLLTSVRDLAANREVLLPGHRGNLLQLHVDLPCSFDAWELEDHYRHHVTDLDQATSVEVLRAIDEVAEVRVERRFGPSSASQVLRLTADSNALDITTDVDWQHRDRILKLAFPLAVDAPESLSQCQFGHVTRPIDANTSWDAARFEVWAHRWFMVRDAAYGVALANASSYGHDVQRSRGLDGQRGLMVRSSLLRAPQSPDPHCDRGVHRFRHSLVPGADVAAAEQAGARLALPLRLVQAPPTHAPIQAGANVIVDAVKPAFDGSGDIVVRLHEARGAAVDARIQMQDPASVSLVDLLEEPLSEQELRCGLDASPSAATLRLHPFQIATLRLAAQTPGREGSDGR